MVLGIQITRISTGDIVAKGMSDHASKAYIFSHFMPYTVPTSPQLSFEADEGIKIPSLPIADSVSIPDISYSDSKEEPSQHDPEIELTPQRDLDPDPASTSFQQPKWAKQLIEAVVDGVGDPYDKRRTRSQYQKESVVLSHIDPLLYGRYFMMLGLDPQYFKEAFHYPRWQEAMDEEFDLLHDNQTWELVPFPPGRWYNANGSTKPKQLLIGPQPSTRLDW